MHEYSIVQALYDRVMMQAVSSGAIRVERVRIRLGEVSGVDAGLLGTAWQTFRVHTICEDAPMDVEIVAARWECPLCHVGSPPGGILRCAACGGPLRLAQGDEIVLDRIVMEVP
jgi:hydrogenase nickel incorporation protein HypA/HybF